MRTRIPLEGLWAGSAAAETDGPRKAIGAVLLDSVGLDGVGRAVVATWHATQRATSLETFELADTVREVARRVNGR